MNKNFWTAVLGLASVIALNTALPVQAEPVTYIETGGKESLTFDPDGLAFLERIGLSLRSIKSTDTPAPGYDHAFDILPGSSNPKIRGTNWVFSYDSKTGNYGTISGTTEFTGSIFFNVDQTKLNLPPVLQIGNFSASSEINTDPNIPQPFFVWITDTANTGLRVFTTVEPEFPNVDLENHTWSLEPVGVVITKEFSNFLIAAGATQSVAGVQVALARADREFVPVSVPEPSGILGILFTAGLGLIVKRKYQA
ncbi:PEP-CTERM sorting domain-containing protein [Calothrix sp. FACHB-1219]|uniref:PEP-CTERM sorting domain-containing protein n=1 Tax=unclassified Calothrix TaxID=2619626 RepID=UPI0016852958|nr:MULTISPECIES: PEP-CTERM sorting domain-containing protein [unclassified Calothrix]MBD2203716.1 PEP-CTERM sorting domain-containing protein [Calothrix sp. FACHB-168]MBD2222063.1 PEP-CTERM sorting domain-containing protein [Calothrix sp. FACHB-1219]